MRKTGTCPKCASTNLIEGANIIDNGNHCIRYNLQVAVQKHPEAACGFTEIYCVDLLD